MKKTISFIVTVAIFMSLNISVYAADSESEQWELVVPENGVELHVIPEDEQIITTFVSGSTDNGIEPLAVTPSTAKIFRIENFSIYPVVLKDGKYQYLNYRWKYTPAQNNLNVNFLMTLEKQQTLIDYAVSNGYEVFGWYLSGSFYMECYIPTRVDYYIYNHESNGDRLKGAPIKISTNKYAGTATISTTALFPKNMDQAYTYGFDGWGYMTVYDAATHKGGVEKPEFSLKATFEVE